MVPTEKVAEGLGGDGDIHGAEERHPVVGAVAECGYLALGVDDWLRSAGENRAACAEAGCDCSRADVSRADGGHHVVPSPGADDDIRREAPCGGKGGEEFSNWLGGGADGRKFGDEIVVDGGADLLAPLARADIEEGGAGGVTELHAQCAGESEVQEIMRQGDMGELGEICGLVLLQPKNLWRGKAGQNIISREGDCFFTTSELDADFVALGGSGGVAPELGGADDSVIGIERHEAVLLTGDAYAGNLGFAGTEIGKDFLHGLREGIPPDGGILLEVAGGQSLYQPIGCAGGGDDFSGITVESDSFQALRATINAEGDHRSSFKMFSRYSCPPLSSAGAGCERAIFSSSANDAFPARIFFPRSEFHEA